MEPYFSIIIPLFNEEENIPELYRRLTITMESLCKKEGIDKNLYEIIMINDGSKDRTWELIKELHKKDKKVKGVNLSRNFGQHPAIIGGLHYAKGEVIILMDGDLQDPPEEIPRLYEKYKEGYDIVYALRKTRDDPVYRKLLSKIFMKIFKKLTYIDTATRIGVFRVMGRKYMENFIKLGEKSKLGLALMGWMGFSQSYVEIERKARAAGKSKYSILKLYKLACDGIISFSNIFLYLHIGIYFGFIVALLSFLMGFYIVFKKLFYGIPISGYTSIIVSIFFLGGISLIILSIIAIYIGKIYEIVLNRPYYIVKDEEI
ncbi:MAG: glycosyltransferase family 2 protein [Candidatus Omnitrophica bacterium]|nr:glycosyltransferase family 2 protein [Candidatus Omnitrophota bacterium]